MTRQLDRDSPLPLWAQLVDRLQARAEAGEFAAGFPSEPRLVTEYGVSRHTVREALRRLRASGAVVSQRGRQSRVVPAVFNQPIGTLYSLYRTIETAGVEQHSEVIRLEITTDAVAAGRLGLTADAPLLVLQRRRLAGGEPIALDTAWLPARLAHPLVDVDFRRTALYDELAHRCGIRVDGGREEIMPMLPDQGTRRQLALPAEVAVLAMHRLGTTADRPVEWRVTLVRGDRYHVTATWSPAHPYQIGFTRDGQVTG